MDSDTFTPEEELDAHLVSCVVSLFLVGIW